MDLEWQLQKRSTVKNMSRFKKKKKLNHKDSNFKLKHIFYKHVSLSVYMQQFKGHVHEHFDSYLKKIQILTLFKNLPL